jgi:hypothetical protein
VIEPALGERRRVEQHAINVDQLPASPGAKLFDHLREFGMLLLLDEGHARHGIPFASGCSGVLALHRPAIITPS